MGYYNEWRPYMSVAEQKAQAKREMNRLRRQGKEIYPVELEGRTIARSFWGKAWCQHIESFSDYENRLPRGTRYVRNGSVCHLEIFEGEVEALVGGSEIYEVSVVIKPLSDKAWERIKDECAGQVGSLLELLEGTLSAQVMSVVSHKSRGLFPKPKDISFSCTCPDWASMCKHVAAVMYGVGHRLDLYPKLLFLLRSVDPEELFDDNIDNLVLPDVDAASELDGEDLGALFGIDIDFGSEEAESATADVAEESKKATKRPPGLGRIVQVKEGVYDADDPELNLSGWRGRFVEAYEDEDGDVLVEVAWDSRTLRDMPQDFIEESEDEGLDWTRMYLPPEQLLPAKARDTKQAVQKAIASIEAGLQSR